MEKYSFSGKELGTGSFGKVFPGTKKDTGERVAIKAIDKNLYNFMGIVNRLEREVDCMKLCECENSVKLLDKDDRDKFYYYIIMEFCETDLNKLLIENKGGFLIQNIREIFLQLNNCFRIMRKKNVIHRDLKLENILIKYSNKTKLGFIPKISDYGLGKGNVMAQNTCLNSDPNYTAPELINNIYYNEKVDLWSIGCIMFELYYNQKYIYKVSLTKMFPNLNSVYPNDPLFPIFKDLLIRLLEEDQYKRISWNDYFNHPFFIGNNAYNRYEKISDFDIGINCDKNLFHCYIAKDNK